MSTAYAFPPTAVDDKDPSDIVIYTMDWTSRLNTGATISTSSWAVQTGLTKVSSGIVTGNLKTSVKVSGGTAGVNYTCTNTITTSDGETLELTGIVRVRER
jgi:hypothetical protein